ncbi:MAG: hypothetical protein HC800_24835, partial [Phormidesmis sp. RL_2_1]|nr:hypothetical protein [Phormidesmis sp. RL_2_1]
PLVIAAGAALAPLVPIAVGAAFGGGFDLAVQGVQIWRGNRDHLDWGSIGISTAGGALSGGLGSFAVSATSTVVNQTIGIAGRALINGVGSALVGGYTQFVRNAINDICLGNGVLSAAGWNGVFGTAASVIPDVIYQPPTTIFRINRSQVNYYRGREVPATYIESTLGPRYPSVTPETTSYPVNNAIAVSAGHLVNNATTLTPLTEN